MNNIIANLLPHKFATLFHNKTKHTTEHRHVNTLSDAEINKEYEIKNVIQDNKELVNFLFTLGCFKGESITLISVLSDTYVISIKDARYSIDLDLAKMVILV